MNNSPSSVLPSASSAASAVNDSARELLNSTSGATSEAVESARQRLAKSLERAQEYRAKLEDQVRQNPLPALGVALGAGLILGWLASRRSA